MQSHYGFNRLQFRHKLWLLVAFPTIIMLLYALAYNFDRVKELSEAKSISHITRTTGLLNIMHRLQYERGRAVIYAMNRDKSSLNDWLISTKRSDDVILKLPEFEKEMKEQGAENDILQALELIQNDIIELRQFRTELSKNDSISFEVVEENYVKAIESVHSNISNLMKLIPRSRIYQLIDSLITISSLKEVYGIERAVVSSIIKKKMVSKEELERVTLLNNTKSIIGDRFVNRSPEHFRQKLLDFQSNRTDIELIETILLASPGDSVKGDYGLWFANASGRIDKLKHLEDDIGETLISIAENDQRQATISLISTTILSFIFLFILFRLTHFSTKKLSDGFVALRNSAVQFIKTGKLEPITIDSRDELSEVAFTFNRLFDELKNISNVVEAVAKGDFNQSVKTKGEDDRLSHSLNHMVKTLRDSVEKMESENWLKTGQGELASRLNSNQSIRALSEGVISFLAEYLKASVGAFYMVDNQNKSSLSATYAYSFRKSSQSEFLKGESIVGQSVLEKKMIIVEQLPEDYMLISSGLGSTQPKNIVVFPLIYADKTLAVIELGKLYEFTNNELEFINEISVDLAVAIHAALGREKLAELLEKSQAQSEELQAQQQELEQANSELSKQTSKLSVSQEELTQQKQELMASNEELKYQSQELEKRNLEVERRSKELSDASKYKSEFLANMSHELRTPLNSLLLLSQTLQDNEEKNLSTEQLEGIRIIYSAGHDLLNLINDILDLSKVEAGKLIIDIEVFPVKNILEQIKEQFEPLAKEKDIDFEIGLDQNTPEVITTDPVRLQQILKNLIGNAIKFTDEGYVRVEIKSSSGNNILFQIQDSGIGIPEKLKYAIFEAFQQGDGSTRRKFSGTGLGLTIAKNLATLLGGRIELDSKLNSGSIFTLVLPQRIAGDLTSENNGLSNPSQINAETITLNQNKTLSNVLTPAFPPITDDISSTCDILIVEDDPEFSNILAKKVESLGFKAILSKSLKSAKCLIKKNIPKAMILDMLLPDGNGRALLEWLQYELNIRDLPIHIISSLDKDEINSEGAIGVSTKPISSEALELALSRLIENIVVNDKSTILVIEDDVNTQKSIQLMLSEKSVKLYQAYTGSEGLRILEMKPVDCIILDLKLPDIDYMELIKQITSISSDRNTPLIIFTASELGQSEYKVLRQYSQHIIIKGSVANERLLDEISRFLEKFKEENNKDFESEGCSNNVLKYEDYCLEGKKVLVVDDDMRNSYALSGLLRRHGMEVIIADNGQLALEKLEEFKDIAIAIMDIMMPIMDGYEAIKQIRNGSAGDKKLPIIALTAKAMLEDREKCLNIGATDYLSKPVDAKELISKISLLANK